MSHGFVRKFPYKILARLNEFIYRFHPMENSPPATQADIQLLRDELQKWSGEGSTEMGKWKESLVDLIDDKLTEFREELLAHREEITGHFDLVFENYARDMRGAAKDEFQMFKDRQGDHGKRITRLESRMQLAG